jgi:hypothetical protein
MSTKFIEFKKALKDIEDNEGLEELMEPCEYFDR